MEYRRPTSAGLVLAFVLTCPVHALSGEEPEELDAIPQSILEDTPATREKTARSDVATFIEDALVGLPLRGNLATPLPPSQPVTELENRASTDIRGGWKLGDGLLVNFSDRANVLTNFRSLYGQDRTTADTVLSNDFREAYLTWRGPSEIYLEAGRINLHNGVALGFNPTDFFKARTLVEQASLDPQDLGANRLGTVMIRGEWIFPQGSIGFAAAPKLTAESVIPIGRSPDLGPRFGSTNGTDRLLLSGTMDLGKDISPQLLLYRQGTTTRLGASLSRAIGDRVVAYGEWAGGRQSSLLARAEAFGATTGTLPAFAASLVPEAGENFSNNLAVGGTFAGVARTTFTIEYHYHQSGFSAADWRHFFDLGPAAQVNADIAKALWFTRVYAADQQEPATQRQVFASAIWPDALTRGLKLSAFSLTDLHDGSTLVQLAVAYDLSDTWTVSALGNANLGSAHTDFGSLPEKGRLVVQLRRYF